MIHIVFQEPDVPVLQQALQLDESMHGDLLLIRDDFAVGPIGNGVTEEGAQQRQAWWRAVLAGGDLDGKADDGSVDDPETVAAVRQRLAADPDEQVWIWAAQNAHDVSGYYWLISQLADFQGRVHILYLNNLPFFNEKGNIFYPDRLAQIPAKEFLKAKKLARPVTSSEFEVDPDEWTRLAAQNKMVRQLEGGKKLAQHDDTFFDAALLKYVSAEWQKASRIIHQFLAKEKTVTGDMYLLWRLKHLTGAGDCEIQGEPKAMKDFELKRKTV